MLEGVRHKLINTPSVSTLIGNDGDGDIKVYSNIIPHGVPPPFVRLSRISVLPSDTKDGPSKLDAIRVQISVFAKTYAEAQSIGESIRSAIDRYSGTHLSIRIQSTQYLDEDDEFENLPEDEGLHHKVYDYQFRVLRS